MDRVLKNKLTEQDKLIRNKMQTIYISKSISPQTFTNYSRYINNRYERLKELISEFIFKNYKKIFLDERWKQIIIAKRINKHLRGLNFKKEIDTQIVIPYLTGVIGDIDEAIENGRKERYLTTRLIELRNKQQSQQIRAFLEEGEIEDIIHDTESYPESRKVIIEKLIDYVDENQTIAVETKKGKVIHYDPKYYADMVLRTVFREIQTMGTLAAADEVGSDLVQVSIHNTACPVCIPFEGKIYSINGKNPAFPPLDDSPPYHPNCLHSLTVTFEEYLNIRGTYEDYIKFSNGSLDAPPDVRNWVPYEERKTA